MHRIHAAIRVVFAGIGVLLFCVAGLNARAAGTAHSDFHGVVTFDVDLDGTVFVISGKRDRNGAIPDPQPAPNVRVEVRDAADKKVLVNTMTDADGNYKLPRFEPGTYKIHVGLLRLDMAVKPVGKDADRAARALVVLVPEEMAPSER